VTPDETYQATKIFNELDVDNSGLLEVQEFKNTVSKMLGGRL
jgi:Ca2+-binding EF-hand superfamily protein